MSDNVRGRVESFQQVDGEVVLGIRADDGCCVQHRDSVRVGPGGRVPLLQTVLLAIDSAAEHDERDAARRVIRLYAERLR